ncbi:hypothetical protein K9M06_02775 [Candidatus Bipolaricaulota bacterium]|nr:hypothetical protein [Candidatus Bipolaricaulota bacterium]
MSAQRLIQLPGKIPHPDAELTAFSSIKFKVLLIYVNEIFDLFRASFGFSTFSIIIEEIDFRVRMN